MRRALLVSTLLLIAIPQKAQAWRVFAGWNGNQNVVEIYPISKDKGAGPTYYSDVEYYSYNTPNMAAANTPDNLEESQVAQWFLFADPSDPSNLSLFMFMDKPHDGSGGSVDLSVSSTGLAGTGVRVSVRDDPGDSAYTWNDATGTMSANFTWQSCCTDGLVLANLPTYLLWSINVQFNSYSGVDQFKVRTLNQCWQDGGRSINNFQIPASQANSLFIQLVPDAAAPTCGAGSLDCPAVSECKTYPGGKDTITLGMGGGNLCETPIDKLDGTACVGDPCIENQTCSNGACLGGTPKDCSGLDSDCSAGSCDPSGACVAQMINQGGPCDDGDLCSEADTCNAGVCTGTTKDCTALDGPCAAGLCNPGTGACETATANEGANCDDGDACTENDSCTSGTCAGSDKDCSGLNDACHQGVCEASSGTCIAEPTASMCMVDAGSTPVDAGSGKSTLTSRGGAGCSLISSSNAPAYPYVILCLIAAACVSRLRHRSFSG